LNLLVIVKVKLFPSMSKKMLSLQFE